MIVKCCIWKFHLAQFAGGPFYETSCGEYITDPTGIEDTCPCCGQKIVYEDEEK